MRSVPGLPLLLAAERLLTGCHLSVDVVLGDVAVTQGRSYWACAVDPASYLVKVGVGLESKLQESFQGASDVISPRSGHSGRDGVWGPWMGAGDRVGWQGITDLLGWSWEEKRRKQRGNGSQAGGLRPGNTWDQWRALTVGFWSVWLGKKMVEKGTASTSFHLPLRSNIPSLRASCLSPNTTFPTPSPKPSSPTPFQPCLFSTP